MPDTTTHASSHTAPHPSPETPPGRETPPALTESRYLAERSKDAKSAIGAALSASKCHAKEAVDVKNVIRHKPLVSVAGAAVAGFATAWIAVPSKERRTARRLAVIERILNAEARARDGDFKSKQSKGVLRHGLRLGMRFARPMIISTLTGALSGIIGGKQADESAGEEDAADGS